MATETDAARDRVIAARAELGAQVDILGASARSAVDFPAKIKRSPAKAAAVAGGIGFLALKGPQRLFGAAKRTIRGKPAPMPKSMLPDEIEATLRALGTDGDKVRGALERDFAAVARVVYGPWFVVVHPSVPARDARELIALARASPGDPLQHLLLAREVLGAGVRADRLLRPTGRSRHARVASFTRSRLNRPKL